jgi:hypothetical protein
MRAVAIAPYKHRKRIKHQHQKRPNRPHYDFRVVQAEQLGEVQRRSGLGGYGSRCASRLLLLLATVPVPGPTSGSPVSPR